MAVRKIVGVTRDSRGRIVSVCVGDVDGQLSVRSVVDDIESRTHAYEVDVGRAPTWVHVVRLRETGQVFLRTGADNDTTNNLDSMPACPTSTRTEQWPIRRDAATVSDDERARLRDAIIELNSRYLTPDDPVSVWFKQDEIHQATHVHGEASFLPWHRVLVNDFERQLQEIDPTLALHYWDWTTDPRRSPDRRGGTVNLMTEDFMGASDGPIGSPFEEAAFYRSTPPNRDQPDRAPASVPPSRVSRRVLSSGRGPREVTLADVPELYSGLPAQDRPRSENVIRIRSDEEIVNRGLGFNRPGLEFERFWRAVYVDHGLAHRYIGGNIGGFGAADTAAAHRSFEDPFVFLLHSNVDRLWASWQLNNRGFNLWEEPAWRVEPAWAYGQLVDDLVEEAEGVVPLSGESQADYDRRYEAELARQGREAGLEIKSTMMPWNGRTTGRITIAPWSRMDATRDIRPTDRAVLRPPRYDRYVIGDELCATWTTLQLGRRLSTHDVVRLQVELDAVALADVEFVLRTGPEVSWWKAIRLPNGGMIETTSASGRASSLHPITELTGGQLIFHKAQGLSQAKRIVFRVADPGWIRGGSRLTFYWEDD